MQAQSTINKIQTVTVNGTVQFHVYCKKSDWEKIEKIGIEMDNLLIPVSKEEFAVLKPQKVQFSRDEFDNEFGSITFDVSVQLECSQEDALLAANYYLNEFNISMIMDKLFLGLTNGDCVMMDINGIWIDWC